MSFSIRQVNRQDLVAEERLYLTSDGSVVVKEGDPRAASLLAGAGQIIPAHIVKRLGLKEGHPISMPDAPTADPTAASQDPKNRKTRVVTPETR